MKKNNYLFAFWLCIVILLLSSYSIAQTSDRLDSLQKVLAKHTARDTARVDILYKITLEQYTIGARPSTLESYAHKAIRLAKKLNYLPGIAKNYYILAVSTVQTGAFKKAIPLFTKQYNAYKQLNDWGGAISAKTNICMCNEHLKNYIQTLVCIDEALKMLGNYEFKEAEAALYEQKGRIYHFRGESEESLKALLHALKLYEEINDLQGIFLIYLGIGNLYLNNKEYDKALHEYKRALKVAKKMENPYAKADPLRAIGIVYKELKRYKEAEKVLKQSLELFQSRENQAATAELKRILGEVYMKTGQYTKAEEHYLSAEKAFTTLEILTLQIEAARDLGNLYKRKNQLTKAEKYLNKGLRIAQQIGKRQTIPLFHDALARIDSIRGNTSGAIHHLRQMMHYKDSISNATQTEKMAELKTEYGVAINQKELKNQKLINEQQGLKLYNKNFQIRIFWIGLALLIIVLFFIIRGQVKLRRAYQLLTRHNQKIDAQKEEIEEQAGQLQSANQRLLELDELKERMTGMIVHDIKSPLNIIIGMAKNPKIRRAGQQILHLATNMLDIQEFESTSVELNLEQVPLAELAQEAYQQVEWMFDQKNIQLVQDFPAGILLEADQELLTRVLINLLNNAAKYSPPNEKITLKATEQEGNVKIHVIDNGEGIEEKNTSLIFQRFVHGNSPLDIDMPSNGLGLSFCKLVVEAHEGQIGVVSQPGKGADFWFDVKGTVINTLAEATPENDTPTEIHLSSDEQVLLSKIIQDLQPLAIYEVSSIRQVLKRVDDTKSNSLKEWKDEVLKAVKNFNTEKYNSLLTVAEPS